MKRQKMHSNEFQLQIQVLYMPICSAKWERLYTGVVGVFIGTYNSQ